MTRPSNITRDRIMKAAERLFAERGYDGTSIRAIVAKAHVNQARPSTIISPARMVCIAKCCAGLSARLLSISSLMLKIQRQCRASRRSANLSAVSCGH
jgi:hypothetical protein